MTHRPHSHPSTSWLRRLATHAHALGVSCALVPARSRLSAIAHAMSVRAVMPFGASRRKSCAMPPANPVIAPEAGPSKIAKQIVDVYDELLKSV